MESRKLVLMNPLQESNGYADIENRHTDTGWKEEGEGGMNRDSNMERYTLP